MALCSSSGKPNDVIRKCRVTRQHSPRTGRFARARFVPRLEPLEDRTLPSYLFQTINDPNAGTAGNGTQGTFAEGINKSGQISGNYGDAKNVTHGFLLSNGKFTTFNDPKAGTAAGQGTDGLGLNDLGQIVGWYWDTTPNPISGFNEHGFLLSNGKYTTIDEPHAVGVTVAESLNDSGQIVGTYLDAKSVYHGFLLSHGTYTTLSDPKAGTGAQQGTFASGINSLGKIVGSYVDSHGLVHGFLLTSGTYTTLDDPNGVGRTDVVAINGSGQIVGYYQDAHSVFHGFLLANGKYTTFNEPKAATGASQGTFPQGINVSGKIVGSFTDAHNLNHGFLATPAPAGAVLGVSSNFAAGSALNGVGGTVNMPVPAVALSNATPPVSAPSTSEVSRSDAVSVVSTTAPAATKHSRVAVDAVFALLANPDDLFRPIAPT